MTIYHAGSPFRDKTFRRRLCFIWKVTFKCLFLADAWNAKLQIDIWWVASYEDEMEARCNSAIKS